MEDLSYGYKILVDNRSAFGTTYGLGALQDTISRAQSLSLLEEYANSTIKVVSEDSSKTFWTSK